MAEIEENIDVLNPFAAVGGSRRRRTLPSGNSCICATVGIRVREIRKVENPHLKVPTELRSLRSLRRAVLAPLALFRHYSTRC